jgi:transcriptional regulator with XRE-family HTH domain
MKIHSDLVKKLRLEKQWSQEQLSEVCGLNLRTIQRLESSGKASMESVRALAAVFAIHPNELMLAEAVEDKHATPFDAVKTCVMKYANFSDTASRFEYWWFFAFVLLLLAVATIIHEKAYQVVSLIVLLPFISAGTRRLKDTGQSGWWQLLFLVPFGFVALFFMLAMESKPAILQENAEPLDVA